MSAAVLRKFNTRVLYVIIDQRSLLCQPSPSSPESSNLTPEAQHLSASFSPSTTPRQQILTIIHIQLKPRLPSCNPPPPPSMEQTILLSAVLFCVRSTAAIFHLHVHRERRRGACKNNPCKWSDIRTEESMLDNNPADTARTPQ